MWAHNPRFEFSGFTVLYCTAARRSWWSSLLASFGQNRPPRLDHSSHGIKTRHSFKKGSGSNELNTAIKLQIYIGIWDKNSDCGPSWLGFLGPGVFVVEVGVFSWFQINWTYIVHFIQFIIILFWIFSELWTKPSPSEIKTVPLFYPIDSKYIYLIPIPPILIVSKEIYIPLFWKIKNISDSHWKLSHFNSIG